MIPLAPPSQERMGEAFLAPQGAAPAPPLQEGMGEAFLVPQGAAPAPPLQEGMGEASLAPVHDIIALGVGCRLVDAHALGHLCRARAPRGRGRCLAP